MSFLPYLSSLLRRLMVSIFFSASPSVQPILNLSKPITPSHHWNQIVRPDLNQSVDVVLQFFIDASSRAGCENLFEQIMVRNLYLNKIENQLGHEFIVIDTVDVLDGQPRIFVLDRIFKASSSSDRHGDNSDTSTSRPASPFSAMEEGMLPTASRITSYRDPLSIFDEISLSAAKVAQAFSDAKFKFKDGSLAGYDRLRGQEVFFESGCAKARNGRHITPVGLSLFDLIILAQVVHDYAPEHKVIDRNCYWYCSMVLDACIRLFPPENVVYEGNVKFSPHDTRVSGRFMGMKVTNTDEGELNAVLGLYHEAHRDAYSTVRSIFSKKTFLANSEQIIEAHDTLSKAKLVDQVDSLRLGQSVSLRENCAKLMKQRGKYGSEQVQ